MNRPAADHRTLSPDELTVRFSPGELAFADTAQVEAGRAQLGEERAVSALELGIRLRAPGYNVFIAGLEGLGRAGDIRDIILRQAGRLPTPPDICYVNNFDDPDRPRALSLKAGEGRQLRKEMEELVDSLARQIPEALKKESFEKEKEQITSAYDRQLHELLEAFQEESRKKGLLVQLSSEGQLIFVPLKEDGEPVTGPEEFESLPEERKKAINAYRDEARRRGRELLKQQHAIFKKVREEVEEAIKKFAAELVDPLVGAIAERHGNGGVSAYIAKVREHILDNLDDFQEEGKPQLLPFLPRPAPGEQFLPYRVNVVVDNTVAGGAPVVVENTPTYQNLFGSIERVVDQTGKLITNFTRIKGGSLLKANGGFLIFDLEDALTEFLVWKQLKRVLKSGRVEIESYNPFTFFSVSGMIPEPVEITTRVVVTGSRLIYALLSAYDSDFLEIFKVLADFAPEEKRDAEGQLAYARRIAWLVRAEGLRHFTAEAVAEVLRHGVRMAGSRDKLSARLDDVDDLVREANLVSEERGEEKVGEATVREALRRRRNRADWVDEKVRELILQGTILIGLEGKAVGQVNGLAVVFLGSQAFGRPSRLTASVSLGTAGIINIEREARLSGSTHDKGVLIIAGYLRNRFGKDKPLSFSASLAFEQSYSGVEGDSASSAELYALLSSLGEIPLRQDLAVTGSVNQMGEIQAIGGVNEKIEGFFRVCRAAGLTGNQGVLIPESNVRNLALGPEVIEAVREGKFRIYPVRTVEEGMEILTGLAAGSPAEEGTVLGIVDAALRRMALSLKEFGPEEAAGRPGPPQMEAPSSSSPIVSG